MEFSIDISIACVFYDCSFPQYLEDCGWKYRCIIGSISIPAAAAHVTKLFTANRLCGTTMGSQLKCKTDVVSDSEDGEGGLWKARIFGGDNVSVFIVIALSILHMYFMSCC